MAVGLLSIGSPRNAPHTDDLHTEQWRVTQCDKNSYSVINRRFSDYHVEILRRTVNGACPDASWLACNTVECVAPSTRCDGVLHCTNGADELNCTECASPHSFACGDGQCIARRLACDGAVSSVIYDNQSIPMPSMLLHCANGADERHCGSLSTCGAHYSIP